MVQALELRPVTAAELGDWLPRKEAEYAAFIMASGSLPEAEARQKARRDIGRLMAGQTLAKDQFVFRLIAAGQPVGWLWLTVPGRDGDPLMAWVSDVEVDPACRGLGYGRQAMLLAEREARTRGMTSIGLNVHGQNAVARGLYDSLGYTVMTQQLKKPLLSGLAPHQHGIAGDRAVVLTHLVRVSIWVRPGSTRPGVGGEHAGALVVRVSARAVDGKATKAALAALAAAFGVPRGAVTLVAGATSRAKIAEVAGGDPAVLDRLLGSSLPRSLPRVRVTRQQSKYSSNSCGCGRSRIGSSSLARL